MVNRSATDEDLLAAFVAGDPRALEELARRYETRWLGLARGLLWQRFPGEADDLARDAVQETWIRIIRFSGGFNGTSRFKTWAYRIVVNQCRNLQSMQTVPAAGEQLDDQPAGEPEPDVDAQAT